MNEERPGVGMKSPGARPVHFQRGWSSTWRSSRETPGCSSCEGLGSCADLGHLPRLKAPDIAMGSEAVSFHHDATAVGAGVDRPVILL
jgi:hypothetical protein